MQDLLTGSCHRGLPIPCTGDEFVMNLNFRFACSVLQMDLVQSNIYSISGMRNIVIDMRNLLPSGRPYVDSCWALIKPKVLKYATIWL